jgi:prepilin peptidase CpaA
VSSVLHYIGYAALVAVAAIATYTDLRTRRIPNWLTLPAILLGLLLGLAADGGPGVLASLGSVALCGGIFLVLFLLGGMGAGDVKMMSAVAAIASWPMAVYALMYTALAGGLLAFGVLIFRGRLGRTLGRMLSLKTYADAKATSDSEDQAPAAAAPPAESDPDRIYVPYGPAIAAGTILAMIL